jgi:hypothetical protein
MIIALLAISATDTLLNALIFVYLWKVLHVEVSNGSYRSAGK